MRRVCLVWLVGLLSLSGVAALAQETAARKPSVLFCCPGENRYSYVGFDYLQSLVKAGFEVDYVENAGAVTWDKVKSYNVLFIYEFPAKGPETPAAAGSTYGTKPPYLAEFWGVLDKFLKAGGGVFLHYCPFYGGTAPNEVLKEWGVQFPLLWLRDPRVVQMSNIPSGMAYTDQVDPKSPVSKDVRGFWYPYDQHYVGQHTMPILVDGNWQVVARPSKAAYTVVPTFAAGEGQPPPGALIPAEPVKDPVLFAVRDYPGGGRLAAVQTWFPFSIGSGMKWLYNNEVLSKGMGNTPSDYGKLLLNTYAWLAEPSLQSGAVGGAVTDPARTVEAQLRPGAMDNFHDWVYQEEEVLRYRRPPSNGRIYRGLIGAQTALSGGTGSVADYAQAAAAAKLDYVIFLEDLAGLTPEKLATLKVDVVKYSTPTLKLYPGYRMKANTGNYLFVCGPELLFPDERCLVGPDKRTFNLQYQNEKGEWGAGSASIDWLLNAGLYVHNNVGYYNFTKSGSGGMKMYDLRLCSMGAVRTYEDGKLVEDMTADYLTTNQCQAALTPVALNLVKSPAELTAAVATNQALTYAEARNLDTLWMDCLRWQGMYDGMNVFQSDGPRILAWPKLVRALAFGGEMFVTGRSLVPSPVHVTSEVGLKEIRIYDGAELFRRFVCNGAKEFETTLFFPNVLQRDMALVVEDIKGGKATSFAYGQFKDASICPVFCTDHVNDCPWCLLTHGSFWPGLFRTPTVPNAGATWDGGPPAARPLIPLGSSTPGIYTDQGNYEAWLPYQIPLLEFSDEGATRCRMVCNRMMADGVPESLPWTGFGPLQPTKVADLWGSHTVFAPYITGVDPNSYGAPGVFEGPIAGLFTEQITFKQDCTVERIRLYTTNFRDKTLPRSMNVAIGQGGQLLDAWDLTNTPEQPKRARLATGGWFATYSSQSANTHLFINRGAPIVLEANPVTDCWLKLWAETSKQPVKVGATYDAEIYSQVWPLDQPITDARSLAEMVTYLNNPTGMKVTRGKHVAGAGGLVELTPENYGVELAVPQPAGVPRTVCVRVSGFNKRWAVGLYQFEGWRTHYYSPENSGWRALGLDFDGRAYAPLYVSRFANTHVLIGHPVVADAAGKDLFIQVTRLNDGIEGKPPAWHISVNNPTDKPVTTTLKRALDLAGLEFEELRLTLAPGEYKVLSRPAG